MDFFSECDPDEHDGRDLGNQDCTVGDHVISIPVPENHSRRQAGTDFLFGTADIFIGMQLENYLASVRNLFNLVQEPQPVIELAGLANTGSCRQDVIMVREVVL